MSWVVMPDGKQAICRRLHLETGTGYGIERGEDEWRVWHNANGSQWALDCASEAEARALIARMDAAAGLGAPSKTVSGLEADHQRRALEKMGLAARYPFGCDAIEHVAEDLLHAEQCVKAERERAEKAEAELAALKKSNIVASLEGLHKSWTIERTRAETAEAELARESGNCRMWATRAEKAECERLIACDDARIRVEKAETDRDAARNELNELHDLRGKCDDMRTELANAHRVLTQRSNAIVHQNEWLRAIAEAVQARLVESYAELPRQVAHVVTERDAARVELERERARLEWLWKRWRDRTDTEECDRAWIDRRMS